MEVRCKNLFYFSRINSIGGIETFFYNLAQKYKDWDIVICYQIGDEEQLRRLRKYVRVIEFNEQKFICEKHSSISTWTLSIMSRPKNIYRSLMVTIKRWEYVRILIRG